MSAEYRLPFLAKLHNASCSAVSLRLCDNVSLLKDFVMQKPGLSKIALADPDGGAYIYSAPQPLPPCWSWGKEWERI